MAWIPLSLRKTELKKQVSECTLNILEYSRRKNAVHRHLSYEQSRYNTEKKSELRRVKSEYTDVRNNRPDVKDDGYEDWKYEYAQAQEEYQANKQDIEDYYDDIQSDLEADAQDEEDWWQQLQTTEETQRDALNQELQAISDQIKTEIDGSTIKF